MNLPITSRIKRSPLLKTAEEIAKQKAQQGGDTSDNDPPKSDPDPKAKRLGTVEGKEQIVKTEVEKEGKAIGGKNNMSDAEWKAFLAKETSEQRANRIKREVEEGRREAPSVETIESKEKGPDLDYDTTIMKAKKEGTTLQPWEVRQQLRAQTRSDRQVNKKRRKLDKYGTFDKDGNFTANKELSAKDARKAQQYESGYTQARSMSNNIRTSTESGQRAGDKYYKGQREKGKGEEPETKQLEAAKKEAIRAAKNKKEEEAGITTSTTKQQDGAVSVDGPNNAFSNATEFGTLQTPQLDPSSAFRKRSSAFKMTGKSPAAKTLQGNQNRLPQHLQDSIKAAPGKMRSGFKMKGYNKR